MTRRALHLLLALLAGLGILMLATGCRRPAVQYVQVPCPPPPVIQRPHLPIQDYKPEWTRDQVLAAYVQSTALLLGWGKAQEAALEAYRIKTAAPPAGR